MWNLQDKKWKQTRNGIVWVAVAGIVTLFGVNSLSNEPLPEEIPSIVLENGREIEFGFTDDNTDETLYIYTDKDTYSENVATAEVYIALFNNTGVDQNVDLAVFFSKDKEREVRNIHKLTAREVKEKEFQKTGEDCKEVKAREISASSTEPVIECTPIYKEMDVDRIYWAKEDNLNKEDYIDPRRFEDHRIDKNNLKEVTPVKPEYQFNEYLVAGEVSYYVAYIEFDPFEKNEKFYIEAIGEDGAYGHLDPWFDSSWGYRFKITSDNTKVANANDNLMYDLSLAPAGFWSNVQADCDDIRMTDADGETEIAVEIVGCNTGSEVGILFFDSSNIATGSDTDFYIYYGNAAATLPLENATYGREAVWNSNYKAVYHLAEDDADPYRDATSNDRDITPTSMTLTGTGKLGGITVAGFDGSSDRLGPLTSAPFTDDPFTLQCWGLEDTLNTTSVQTVMYVGDTDYRPNPQISVDSNEKTEFSFRDNTAAHTPITGSVTLSTATWYWFENSSTGSAQDARVNNSSNGTASVTTGSYSDGDQIIIGTNNAPNADQYWDGLLQECRILGAVLSTNWRSTEYANMNANNTFWTTGTEEAAPNARRIFFITQLVEDLLSPILYRNEELELLS